MKCERVRRILSVSGGVAALVVAGGCAAEEKASLSNTEVPRAFVRRAPFDPGTRTVTSSVPLMSRASTSPTRLMGTQRLSGGPGGVEGVAPGVMGGDAGELRDVKLSVAEARVQEVLHALLGPDGMDVSYVLDPVIQKSTVTMTMDVEERMTPRDIRNLLDGLALMYGWTVSEIDGVVFVGPSEAMLRNANTPILQAIAAAGGQAPAIRVRRMRHIQPSEVNQLLADLTSQGGKIAGVGRTLVMVDTTANLNRMSRLLDALDVPAFEGVELWTYRLTTRSPESAVQLLGKMVGPTNLAGSGTEAAVAFFPIPGTSKLVVISRDPTIQSTVRDFIEQIDHPLDEDTRHAYIYRIQYYNPSALQNLVNSFFADRIESSGTVGSAGGATGGTPSGDDDGDGLVRRGMRLTLDPDEKFFLIRATPEDFADLVSMIRMVDRPRQQVILNSIIAEVRLSDTLEYGVEYFLRALEEDGLGILELAGGVSDLITGNPTGSAFFAGADGFVIIQALERVSDVTIVQQPRIVARDGSTATLLVGGQTPISDGSLATDTGAIQSATSYRDTGITLEITPDVNESGDVTLEIIQEINNVLGQTDLGPEFVTRKIQTSVTVPHGGTLLLGGIIDSSTTKTARKIPLLADLPGVGAAFQSQLDGNDRTELLLAITPTIVNTPADGEMAMREFLDAAQGLQVALYDRAAELERGVLNPEYPRAESDPAIPLGDDVEVPEAPELPPPGLEALPPDLLEQLEDRSEATDETGTSGAMATDAG